MKSLRDLQRDFSQVTREVQKFRTNLPRIIGVESVKIVHENFQKQGYDSGRGFSRWVPRKSSTNAAYDRGRVSRGQRRARNSTYGGSVYSSRNPILRQTLALYNSIQYKVMGTYVFIGTNLALVPYAKAHNEGLGRQPRRQYMPRPNEPVNPKITGRIKRITDYETARIMRLFKR